MSDLRIRPAALTPPAPTTNAVPVDMDTRCDAWLREFERARWQAQPHYERDAARLAADGEAPGELHHAAMPPTPLRQATTDAINSALEAVMPETTALPSQGDPSARDAHGRARYSAAGAPEAPAAGFTAAPAVARPTSAEAEAAEAPLARTRPTPADAQWSSRHVHVHAGEQCTSVWIRDVRLSSQDAVRLLDRLQPELGPDLRLTLNGRPVDRNDRNPQR